MRLISEQAEIKADLASGMTQTSVADKWGISISMVSQIVAGRTYKTALWPNGDTGRMPDIYRKTQGVSNHITGSSRPVMTREQFEARLNQFDYSKFETPFEKHVARTRLALREYETVEEMLAEWEYVMADEYERAMNNAEAMVTENEERLHQYLDRAARQEAYEKWCEENPEDPATLARFELMQDWARTRQRNGPCIRGSIEDDKATLNMKAILFEIQVQFDGDESDDGRPMWFLEMFLKRLYFYGRDDLAQQLIEEFNTDNWTDPIPEWKLANIAKANDL